MLFRSCLSVRCATIVAIAPGWRVSTCPTCGHPLSPLETRGGPPMGFARKEIETMVKEHGGAYWHVAIRCVER